MDSYVRIHNVYGFTCEDLWYYGFTSKDPQSECVPLWGFQIFIDTHVGILNVCESLSVYILVSLITQENVWVLILFCK